MAISVKTELIPVTLNFDNGDTGTFFVNVNRVGFMEEMSELGNKIQKKVEEIDVSGVVLDENGQPLIIDDDEEHTQEELNNSFENAKKVVSIYERCNRVFIDEIESVFGEGSTEVIFRYNAPLSKHKGYGAYYVQGILRDITNEIRRIMNNKQVKPASAHIKKKKK